MARGLSTDLRERVVKAVASGMSRRAAAGRFGVSASSVIRWVQRWQATGRLEARSQGGDRRSGRIEAAGDFLLARVQATPDVTLAELQAELEERGLAVGIGTLWRFFDRHGISFKKNRSRRRAGQT
jgi:transposase